MGSAACAEVIRPTANLEFSSCDKVDEEFHVLAVDDSLVDRKVVEKLLRTSSCKVTVAESGKMALQYLGLLEGETTSTGLNVNLILTDYSMPGMTGYELMKKIKESTALKEIPVVIMSSENIVARIHRCLEEGAKDYILKPVKLSDVTRLKDFMMRGGFNQYELKEDSDSSRGSTPDYSAAVDSSSVVAPPSVSSTPTPTLLNMTKLSTSQCKTSSSPRCNRRRPRRYHRKC